jgi:sarcosine oxidase, subunit gamma
MLDLSTARQGPLDLLAAAPGSYTAAELSIVEPEAKFVLRCRAAVTAVAGNAFGVALPEMACRAAFSGDRAALWLGPDEWFLIAAPDHAPAVTSQLSLALGDTPHSLVDVSHRGVAITVKGQQAAALINHGCPLDLSPAEFPVGMCARTLFERAEIILWRVDEHTYRLEIERSFAAYVWRMLVDARGGFI